MKSFLIIILFLFYSLSCFAKNDYEKVASHIINNLKSLEYYRELGIKRDTLLDINKDGIIDSISYDLRFDSYLVNDSVYYSLHAYGKTVMEEINEKFYIYDVILTDSYIDKYVSYSVYEILNNFDKRKVIEFRVEDSLFVKNNSDKNFIELKKIYLKENNFLKCLPTDRKLTKENSINYGWNNKEDNVHLFSDGIEGEVVIGQDTIICLSKFPADRNPYNLEYVRINSESKDKYSELNKLLKENRINSQTRVFEYNAYLVFYKHGWLDPEQAYDIIIVDYKNKNKAHIIEHFEFDYRYNITPVYDENEFIIEEEAY